MTQSHSTNGTPPYVAISLVRFSPAWFIFVLGLAAIAAGLFMGCFVTGEFIAMQMLSMEAPV